MATHHPSAQAPEAKARRTQRLLDWARSANRARNLIALAFVSVAVVPVVFLGLWVNDAVSRIERTSMDAQHRAHATQMASLIQLYVADVESVFGSLESAADELDAAPQVRERMRVLATQMHIRWFALYSADGTRLANLAITGAPETEPGILSRLREQATSADVRFTGVLRDTAGAPAVFAVRQTDDGGFAAIEIGLGVLQTIQKSLSFGREGHGVLLDQLGRVIAHPDAEAMAEQRDLSLLDPVRRAMAGPPGVAEFYSDTRRQQMTAGYARLERTGWIVLTPQPVAEINAMSTEVESAAGLVAFIGLATAAALAWALSGALVGPVESLTRTVQAIAVGGSPNGLASLRVTTHELNELGRSFDALARRIESDRDAVARATETERAALLASVAGNFPGVVFRRVLEADGVVSHPVVNTGGRDPFGLSASTAMFSLENVVEPIDLPRLVAALAASAHDLTPIAEEVRILGVDGRTRWARCAGAPRRRENGAIVWDGVLFDVTELVEAEEALRQAKENAEALSQAKSDFLANMSHELRTPLNVILGFAEMMRCGIAGPMADRPREYSGLIHASATHLLDLINRLLDLSKMEAGQLEMNDVDIPLVDELTTISGLLDEQARARNVSLKLRLTCAPTIRFDRLALRQIMLNLMSNAVKFSPEGDVVTVAADMGSGGVEIRVVDHGAGIPRRDLARVFERFYSRSSTVRTENRGAGLGLPIAKSLADLHGADLSLDSAVGEGATARLVIPHDRIVTRHAA